MFGFMGRARRALSLVEVAISTTLIVLASIMAFSALDIVIKSTKMSTTIVAHDLDAERMVDLMANEIALAARSQVTNPTPGLQSNTIDFTYITGFPTSGTPPLEPIYSPQTRYTQQPMFGELMDGLDNNGNGLVDEQFLVRQTLGASPNTFEIGGFVSNLLFDHALAAPTITIFLTVTVVDSQESSAQGAVVTKSFQATRTVTLINE